MIVLGFYKYVELEDVEELAERVREFCKERNYKGSVLLGEEGINASVSGDRKEIDALKKFLTGDERFSDLFFKEEETIDHPFKKMKVKVKKEIVGFYQKVNLENTGNHINGEELLDMYENGKLKEGVVIVDARNDYEFKVGRFKGAIELDLKTFREFPEKIKKIENMKDKKIVMYCTGGVRCEKASAYLREQGFKDVSQLNQGVIQFGKEHDDLWEGKCFVFDKRMVSPMNSEGDEVGECYLCGKSCDFLRNCKNVYCNLFYISCLECEEEFCKCCSKECADKIKMERNIQFN